MHLLLIPFHLLLLPILLTVALLFAVFRFSGACAGFACRSFRRAPRGPGNSAFDDYRDATLRKLDDEAREFRTFLDKLRRAADAADFQAYLNERGTGGPQTS